MMRVQNLAARHTSCHRVASRRLSIVRRSSQQDVETNQPRAPNTPPGSGFSTPPRPPPPPPQPTQAPQGAAPTRRELLALVGGTVLGVVGHTMYMSNTTIELTDPETLEKLFKSAILEEQVLQAKQSVVQLEAALEEIDEQLAADEAAIRAGKAIDGRDLEDVRTEAEVLRTQRVQILTLTGDMKQAVVEMTQILKQME